MKLIIYLFTLFLFSEKIYPGVMSENLSNLLPEKINGWARNQNDQIYDSESLYEYINGGAELYISYSFRSMLSRKFEKEHSSITVDIFDMGESKNAFGVFSKSRETIDGTFGQGCQIYDEAIIFWKDRYYISLIANDSGPDIKKNLHELAQIIEGNIETEGILPELIDFLPKENIIEESLIYFHHTAWQNSYFFIAHDNILNIDEGTDAVLVKYREEENELLVLLVEYTDSMVATLAYKNFSREFFEGRDDNLVIIEDGKWIGCDVVENNLICIFNSNTEKLVESKLTAIKASIISN